MTGARSDVKAKIQPGAKAIETNTVIYHSYLLSFFCISSQFTNNYYSLKSSLSVVCDQLLLMNRQKPHKQVCRWLNTMNEQGCMTCHEHLPTYTCTYSYMPTLFVHCVEPGHLQTCLCDFCQFINSHSYLP